MLNSRNMNENPDNQIPNDLDDLEAPDRTTLEDLVGQVKRLVGDQPTEYPDGQSRICSRTFPFSEDPHGPHQEIEVGYFPGSELSEGATLRPGEEPKTLVWVKISTIAHGHLHRDEYQVNNDLSYDKTTEDYTPEERNQGLIAHADGAETVVEATPGFMESLERRETEIKEYIKLRKKGVREGSKKAFSGLARLLEGYKI